MRQRSEEVVAVIGQGYVGLPLAMAAVEAGFTVFGVDVSRARIADLERGTSPIEDVSDGEVQFALATGRYSPTVSWEALKKTDFAVVTVPTPLKGGRPDLSFIEQAMQDLGSVIGYGSTVILESTTYPGTTEELALPILEKNTQLTAGTDFYLGYSPERIDPGNRVWTLKNTPKVVSGMNLESLKRVNYFYSALGIPTVQAPGTKEAELSKLLENTFRHVNIALVNELAKFSDALGVNLWQAIDLSATKPFGFMKFLPGPGVGGHCLPVDPSYLSWAIEDSTGASFEFVDLANRVNKTMPHFVVSRIHSLLDELNLHWGNSSVLLVGLAYKPNTGDIRESPALEIARLLNENGVRVTAIDDWVRDKDWPNGVERISPENLQKVDISVILTDHAASPYDDIAAFSKLIFDTRNRLSGPKVRPL